MRVSPAVAPQLPRGLTVLLGTAAAVVVAAGVRGANEFLAPALLALVLTVAVMPVRTIALRHRWPSWAATLAMMVTAYAIVLFLAASVAIAIVQLAAALPDYATQANDLTANLHDTLTKLGLASDPSQTAVSQLDIGKLVNLISSLLSNLLGALSSAFFLVVLLFFVTADAATAGVRATLLTRSRPTVVDAITGFTYATQRYLLMSALFGGIVAVFDTVALWLLGIPLPLLWGLLAFVTNFIPNIGFVIGVIPPALLALLDGGWEKMVAVLVVYSTLNVIIQTLIQPRYVGDAVGLNPTMTFFSLTVWTFLLGPFGALLAVPATLLVRAVLIDVDPAARWALLLIGSAPEPEQPPPTDPAIEEAGSSEAGASEAGSREAPAPRSNPAATPAAEEV